MDFMVYYFQTIIFVLVSVAFLTLMERKVLGLSQNRKGPNKVGWWGLLQPFSDALKLFSKQEVFIISNNLFLFVVSPFFSFIIMMLFWMFVASLSGYVDFYFSIIFFLCCISVSLYGMVFAGWGSNSKYALLGALRGVAQTISYEIMLSFIFFIFIFVFMSYSFNFFFVFQRQLFLLWFLGGLLLIFFMSLIVETNRAPFDLAEGESELVSGFNIEYGGLKFALIFMGEYSSIVWMSLLGAMLVGGVNYYLVVLWVSLIVLFFLLRSSYPRIRYDFMMLLMWKSLLVIVLVYYLFMVCCF